jgi:hypothetical protein
MTAAIVAWVSLFMWMGVAVWVFFDARRTHRAAVSNALATFLLPGLGLAVYLGTRESARRSSDEHLSPNGARLLRELTAEVERLRHELDVERAKRPSSGPT